VYGRELNEWREDVRMEVGGEKSERGMDGGKRGTNGKRGCSIEFWRKRRSMDRV